MEPTRSMSTWPLPDRATVFLYRRGVARARARLVTASRGEGCGT